MSGMIFQNYGGIWSPRIEDANDLAEVLTLAPAHMEKGNVTETAAKPTVLDSTPTSGLRDVLLGGGIAFAAIGSTLAYAMNTLAQISLIKAAVTLMVIVLVVVFFTTISGWSRLRHRDMSALLEAAGWSVNFRMYMTHQLGDLFTRTPGLPEGAKKEHHDLVRRFLRQGDRRRLSWPWIVILSVALGAVVFIALMAVFEINWSTVWLWLISR